MSGPARQRSLRDRLHGIGLSWHKSHSVDTHGYPNPLEDAATVRDHGDVVPAVVDSTTTVSPSPAILGQSAEMKPMKSPVIPEKSISPEKPSPTEKKPLVRAITQPPNTEEYIVKVSDTLTGIAARFDITPSELAKLNRLSSRMIFPGQSLYVPRKKKPGTASSTGSPTEAATPEEPDSVDSNPTEVPSSSASKESVKLPTPATSPASNKAKTIEPINLGKAGTTSPSSVSCDLDKECLERFLKINARYITDGQGIVTGVLLVTPNALMFDPNVSDPLVIEHGADSYGVVAPMEMIFRAAMYTDIARMRVKHAPEVPVNVPKADVYYGEKGQLSQSQSEDEQAQNATTQSTESTVQKPLEERTAQPAPESEETKPPGKEGDTKPDDMAQSTESKTAAAAAKETEKKTEDEAKSPDSSQSTRESNARASSEDVATKSASPKPIPSGRGSIPEELEGIFAECAAMDESATSEGVPDEESQITRQGSRRERMMKRLSYPVESLSSYTQSSISKIFSTSPKNLMDFSGGMFVRTSEDELSKGKEAPDSAPPSLEKANGDIKGPSSASSDVPVYKNMVDTKYDILASLDKIIPRPARSCDDPPLYLCLRMGRPINKKVLLSSPVLSYGKKRLQKEYWFSIPRERADDLYIFFNRWAPEVYGDVEEVRLEDRGFEPIETDEEGEEGEEQQAGSEETAIGEKDSRKGKRRGPFALLQMMGASQFIPLSGNEETSPTDWEVVSLREGAKLPSELDLAELPIPDLSEKSEILTEDHRREICKNLPARAEGYAWTLLYSTSKHGFSLKTLYREMLKYETPVVLVIMDTEGTVFGALTSGSLRVSEHFYGTGETYLFTFKSGFKCYRWTGENMYFIKGNTNSLVIGAGDGQFGLWLDEDLYHGRSHQCKTFQNDMLSSQEDFVVKALEAWGFV